MESQLQETNSAAFEEEGSKFFKSAVPPISQDSLESPSQTLAALIVNRITEGRIFPGDRKFIADAIREAYFRRDYRQLQQDINELLSASGSDYRLLIDDALCNGDTAKMMLLYLIDKQSGAVTSGMSAIISVKRGKTVEHTIVPSVSPVTVATG